MPSKSPVLLSLPADVMMLQSAACEAPITAFDVNSTTRWALMAMPSLLLEMLPCHDLEDLYRCHVLTIALFMKGAAHRNACDK